MKCNSKNCKKEAVFERKIAGFGKYHFCEEHDNYINKIMFTSKIITDKLPDE